MFLYLICMFIKSAMSYLNVKQIKMGKKSIEDIYMRERERDRDRQRGI